MKLSEYLEQEKTDPNLFWHLSSGEHQNLLDLAIDCIDDFSDQLSKREAKAVKLLQTLEDIYNLECVAGATLQDAIDIAYRTVLEEEDK